MYYFDVVLSYISADSAFIQKYIRLFRTSTIFSFYPTDALHTICIELNEGKCFT